MKSIIAKCLLCAWNSQRRTTWSLDLGGGCSLSCVNCDTIGAANNTGTYTCVYVFVSTQDKIGDETEVLPMSDQLGEQTHRQQLVCVCKREREKAKERQREKHTFVEWQ